MRSSLLSNQFDIHAQKKLQKFTWDRRTSLYVPISLNAMVNLVITGPKGGEKRLNYSYDAIKILIRPENNLHVIQNWRTKWESNDKAFGHFTEINPTTITIGRTIKATITKPLPLKTARSLQDAYVSTNIWTIR